MVGGQGTDPRESQRENTRPSPCLVHPVTAQRRTWRCDADASFNTSRILSNFRLEKREWGRAETEREGERERGNAVWL